MQQLSTDLLEQLGTLHLPKEMPLPERIGQLYLYQLKMQTIDKLGWYEHTSDWDFNLMVELNNGTTVGDDCDFFEFDLNGEDAESMVQFMNGLPNTITLGPGENENMITINIMDIAAMNYLEL